uniref:Uncharacterized protein n=1 Tax=Arundo donax TaxID=35708 RepID=A0A0A9H8N0_ARUDO
MRRLWTGVSGGDAEASARSERKARRAWRSGMPGEKAERSARRCGAVSGRERM